jgi:uncharacterized membrane protein YfcA
MEISIIAIAALTASLLTFFSGFGLGTILTPVFVLFFPVEIAIALTGIVHLLNNFFKIGLVGRRINWNVGFKFGGTAVIGAFAGAEVLFLLSKDMVMYSYTINDKLIVVPVIKFVIAVLMIVFVMFEIIPSLKKIQLDEKKLFFGGLISGFFGGLSGNQGALRSMFLLRCGLTKKSFIATGVLIACVVDTTRLSVYFSRLASINLTENLSTIAVAAGAAFTGAFIGNNLLKKVTLGFVHTVVTVLVIILAICLGAGLV